MKQLYKNYRKAQRQLKRNQTAENKLTFALARINLRTVQGLPAFKIDLNYVQSQGV